MVRMCSIYVCRGIRMQTWIPTYPHRHAFLGQHEGSACSSSMAHYIFRNSCDFGCLFWGWSSQHLPRPCAKIQNKMATVVSQHVWSTAWYGLELAFFLFRYLLPPAESMWVPAHCAPASDSTHGKAAMAGGRLPTRVGKDFVQGGFGPACTTLSAGRQLKQ